MCESVVSDEKGLFWTPSGIERVCVVRSNVKTENLKRFELRFSLSSKKLD